MEVELLSRASALALGRSLHPLLQWNDICLAWSHERAKPLPWLLPRGEQWGSKRSAL